jgi:putative membrane protein
MVVRFRERGWFLGRRRFIRRRRFIGELVMSIGPLTEHDRACISAEIKAAEALTAGEIYVVINRENEPYRAVSILWGSLVALVIPWPLHLLTYWPTTNILVAQVLAFVFVSVLISHPAVHYRFVPRALSAERARKNAIAQFMAHGIHLTENRTGVLIYVALVDRCVEVVADAGINSKVAQSEWDELAAHIIRAARAEQLLHGILTAIKYAGTLLARHFPTSPNDRNELPDHVVEI